MTCECDRLPADFTMRTLGHHPACPDRKVMDLDADPYALSKRMEFDHVVRVHDDGSVTDMDDVHAPEAYWSAGDIEGVPDDWTLLSGYTGQYGYNGPVMHPSEFIGGGLAQAILDTPGLYVALAIDDIDNGESVGWTVAYQEV